MSSMTKRNVENAQSAKTLVGQTRKAADTSSLEVEKMNVAMADVKSSSEKITKIIKTIDELAFQTNILALNAAVEAARAGEAGAGFAVVADEVRNLAQRSAQAARETAEKIEDALAKTQNGVLISGNVAKSLGDITSRIREVDQLMAEIAAASSEQSQGIQQINTATTQMDKVTQSNAAMAEEAASAAEELTSQAIALREELTRLIGSKSEPSRSPARPPGRSVAASASRNGQVSRVTTRRVSASEPAAPSGRGTRPVAASIPLDGDFKDF
jgi:methyl-accepting chemotaxis protein